MADQWEMCDILYGPIQIYNPKGVVQLNTEQLMKRHKEHVTGNGQYTVICLLFSDGWEPYAVDRGYPLFRRMYQG